MYVVFTGFISFSLLIVACLSVGCLSAAAVVTTSDNPDGTML